MSTLDNIRIARTFLEGVGGGRDPIEIAAPFADDLIYDFQGDTEALPWIGRRTGRTAVEHFIADLRSLTETVSFAVEDILASDSRAAIVGALATRIKATNRTTSTQFAIILTIAGETITRFQMIEDSYDVSRAARL
ncbi:nuclear transport factor 2 family protein [Sphingomonas sp. AR_OL41]|uniref:nuclear transport factor 2 family protein n=1 Tax=Sphingomonas sp. AR_OL41 TaxID=3042729 RepID=UPI002480BAA3|nr:nuclear transport factor 2 family protein [Sphingomonas sp. AR_OL41]MDH7972848.1 nuclear transport factor 2 family protein [Sphingomonas sp. AR_OL41]